jgi:hypothetical protein
MDQSTRMGLTNRHFSSNGIAVAIRYRPRPRPIKPAQQPQLPELSSDRHRARHPVPHQTDQPHLV